MIGLLLSSVSKHNMWSCYDWVFVVVFRLLTQYIIRPHIVFIYGRQRQPNHNTTTYCVYWRTTTNDNPIIISPHIVLTDERQQQQPNHNTTIYCPSLSKHTMWSYYDWVYCCCRPSVNTICGRFMIGLSLLSSVSKHTMRSCYDTTYCAYWQTTTTTTQSEYDHILCLLAEDNNNPIIVRPHIVFTDGQQRQTNYNTTTYRQ
jgi:hypothetical protein